MFEVKVDRIQAIVKIALGDSVAVVEMERFLAELRDVLLSLQGRDIRMKADLRAFKPMAPEVAERIRQAHAFALGIGVRRIAEIVGSDLVALQLQRVARESGGDRIIRRFRDEEAATEWLLQGDAPASSTRHH